MSKYGQLTTTRLWIPKGIIDRTVNDLVNPPGFYQKVEYHNPHANVNIDLFGFGDYLVMYEGDLIAVQVTGPAGHPEHKRKILAEERAKRWLETGNRIQLLSWRKLLKKRGQKVKVWQPRIEEITLEMFEELLP